MRGDRRRWITETVAVNKLESWEGHETLGVLAETCLVLDCLVPLRAEVAIFFGYGRSVFQRDSTVFLGELLCAWDLHFRDAYFAGRLLGLMLAWLHAWLDADLAWHLLALTHVRVGLTPAWVDTYLVWCLLGLILTWCDATWLYIWHRLGLSLALLGLAAWRLLGLSVLGLTLAWDDACLVWQLFGLTIIWFDVQLVCAYFAWHLLGLTLTCFDISLAWILLGLTPTWLDMYSRLHLSWHSLTWLDICPGFTLEVTLLLSCGTGLRFGISLRNFFS